MTNVSTDLCEQQKSLRDWAEEGLMFDEVQRFLKFCKDDDKEVHKATEIVSYTEFLTLKERFEA